MAQSSQQFTAAKVLEAAHQAESSGNRDYAIQFYRHIVEQHPTSPEAVHAREGLARMVGQDAHEGQTSLNGSPSEQTQPSRSPPQATQPYAIQPGAQIHRIGSIGAQKSGSISDQSYVAEKGASRVNGSPQVNGSQSEPKQHETAPVSADPTPSLSHPGRNPMDRPPPLKKPAGPPPAPPPSAAPNAHSGSTVSYDQKPAVGAHVHLPAPKDHYPMGRGLARLFSAVRWLMVIVGMVFAAVAIGGPELVPAARGMVTLVSGLVLGFGSMIGGLVIILSAQLARAVFDNANSARDLAMIERLRAGQQGTN